MPVVIRKFLATRFCRSLVCALALIAATFTGSRVTVGAEPFKSRVTANWDDVFDALPPAFGRPGQASFAGTSQTTHLGRAAQRGKLSLHPSSPTDIVIPGDGSVTIIAANGDQLTFNYTGNLYALTGEGKGTFTFTGGTGRFANATGNGTFYAVIDLSQPAKQPMTVVLDGQIGY
jgi:hypothetical protein